MKTIIRHDWKIEEVLDLFSLPFGDLIFKAHTIHRENFDPNSVQLSTLCSIKTGACPEDCKYCSQSSHYNTSLKKEPLINNEEILAQARKAKENGSTRFCMGAAWRKLNDKDLPQICSIISEVKALGMETCVTLGMLNGTQAQELKNAGLDYYNHNIDTSPEFYDKIITTRTFADRMNTIANVQDAGINVCCGGIIGMGESLEDRASMLTSLANLEEHPQSVPVNMLVPIEGTPLGKQNKVDPFDFVAVIAVARIMMPKSAVRLSAGRMDLNAQAQFLCFFAGANSIFYGEKLLTTQNSDVVSDSELFKKLQINSVN